ncbi:MAG TPA: protoporphyrinogen oxidase [Symbiobacteriaceae bacterium]|jgi:oxygen-dependent protoporphyrinogen oxidase
MTQTIVIAGGGVTGIAAAYQVQKYSRTAGIDARIIVVEREPRLGGKTQTEVVDGCVIEHGPDSYIAYKPWFSNLAKELGLSTTGTNPAIRSTYIYHKGRMEALPVGMNIMIPTEVWPFLKTRLLTPLGKLRAGLEPFMPIRKTDDDESIGSFVGRRFGREVLDHVAGPLMGGIHGGDWDGVSIKATFPTFPKMEKEHGSLLLQGWRNKANKPKGPTGSAFQTVPTGLRSVVDALIKACDGVQFRIGTEVTAVTPASSKNEYVVDLSTGERIDAQAVILAVPAYVAAGLVEPHLADVAGELNEIPYGNSVVVAMVYNKSEVGHPLNASGFLVPHTEPLDITASTWVSSKWLHAAPPDKALLRCFLGRGYGKDWTQESDEAILASVKQGLNQTMGLTAEPVLHRIFRWPRAMAQYRVGHLDRIDRVDELMAKAPGLYLAGAAYRGVGLPDCVREGNQAAEKAAKHMGWIPHA